MTIAEDIEACRKCELGALRVARHGLAVPAEMGATATRPLIAIMGEAPGAQEDATGHPFVGKAGQILGSLLRDCGLTRSDILIMNRVRCRPPGNSLASHPDAVYQCEDWLKAELEEYDPAVVLLMGGPALSTVFGSTATVGATRGTHRHTGPKFEYGHRVWIPTYHPASLLPYRSPKNRPLVVADIMAAVRVREDERGCVYGRHG